jgi:hypothetical protein
MLTQRRKLANRQGEESEAEYWQLQAEAVALRKLVNQIVDYCKDRPRQYHPLRAILQAIGGKWSERLDYLVCKDSRVWTLPLDTCTWQQLGLAKRGIQMTGVCWNHTQTRSEQLRHNRMAYAVLRKG